MSGSSAVETKANQDVFLTAYSLVGALRKAGDGIDLPRATVRSWIHTDSHGFKARFQEAQEVFREFLEDIALERVKNQKPNDNPVLLITLLNANYPEKYRRAAYHTDNAAKEIMGEWKKWVKESKKHAKTKDEVSDRDNAIEEAEKILAKKSNKDSDN